MLRLVLTFLTCLLVLSLNMGQRAHAADPAKPQYRVIAWEDLMPEGEWEMYDEQLSAYIAQLQGLGIQEGSSQDAPVQLGTYNVVTELDGKKIRMPGFVLPFEFAKGKKISEFLLVPYFGACVHSPPPPPNQVVYVKTLEPVPFDDVWEPIWAEGTLSATSKVNDLGDAAYTLTLESWETYQQ